MIFRNGIGLQLKFSTQTTSALLLQDFQVEVPAEAFYGSDTLWIHSMLLVNDPDFEDACSVLHTNGFKDVPTDQSDYKFLQPPDSDPDGKDSVRWRMLCPSGRSGGETILIPASHWHFEVTDDTTIIVDGIRLPKFSSYLQIK